MQTSDDTGEVGTDISVLELTNSLYWLRNHMELSTKEHYAVEGHREAVGRALQFLNTHRARAANRHEIRTYYRTELGYEAYCTCGLWRGDCDVWLTEEEAVGDPEAIQHVMEHRSVTTA